MTTSPTSVIDPSGDFQALPSDSNCGVLGSAVLVFGACQMPSRTCDRDMLGTKGCPLQVSSTCTSTTGKFQLSCFAKIVRKFVIITKEASEKSNSPKMTMLHTNLFGIWPIYLVLARETQLVHQVFHHCCNCHVAIPAQIDKWWIILCSDKGSRKGSSGMRRRHLRLITEMTLQTLTSHGYFSVQRQH